MGRKIEPFFVSVDEEAVTFGIARTVAILGVATFITISFVVLAGNSFGFLTAHFHAYQMASWFGAGLLAAAWTAWFYFLGLGIRGKINGVSYRFDKAANSITIVGRQIGKVSEIKRIYIGYHDPRAIHTPAFVRKQVGSPRIYVELDTGKWLSLNDYPYSTVYGSPFRASRDERGLSFLDRKVQDAARSISDFLNVPLDDNLGATRVNFGQWRQR